MRHVALAAITCVALCGSAYAEEAKDDSKDKVARVPVQIKVLPYKAANQAAKSKDRPVPDHAKPAIGDLGKRAIKYGASDPAPVTTPAYCRNGKCYDSQGREVSGKRKRK